MSVPRYSIRTVRGLAALLLLLGLVANEWVLAALFSPDGELSASNVGRIRTFDVLCVVLGLALFATRKSLSERGARRTLAPVCKRALIAYVAAGTMLLTILIALFALNTAAPSLWKLSRSDAEIQNEARWREIAVTRHLVYAELSNEEESQLLSETWQTPYRFEPWVGFRERPRSGRFVNVSAEGFRHSGKPDRTLATDAVRIFVFGGSTTFGYGVADASTIPAFLEGKLEARFPGVPLEVFNFGRSFYYSGQETVLLIDLIRAGEVPDVAIFIDGVNEGQTVPFYTEEMARLFRMYAARDDRALFVEVLDRIPITRFLRSGPREVDYTADNFTVLTTVLDADGIGTAYERDRALIRTLGERYGFTTYFFLQPMPGYENEFLNHPLQSARYLASFEHTREKLERLEELMDESDSFSMTHLLAGFEGYAFVDQFHYTPEVSDLIAAFVAERVELAR